MSASVRSSSSSSAALRRCLSHSFVRPASFLNQQSSSRRFAAPTGVSSTKSRIIPLGEAQWKPQRHAWDPVTNSYNPKLFNDHRDRFDGFSQTSNSITLKAMLNAGMHYGVPLKRVTPTMEHFAFMEKDGLVMFDLTKTMAALKRVVRLFHELTLDDCNILFVGDTPHTRDIIRRFCSKQNLPFFDGAAKWIPGTLTNFNEMVVYHRRAKKVESKKQALKQLKRGDLFRRLDRMPDAIFILNRTEDHLQIQREAWRMRIPLIGVNNLDSRASGLDYTIPCNTNSQQALCFVMDIVTRAIQEAKSYKSQRAYANVDENDGKRQSTEEEWSAFMHDLKRWDGHGLPNTAEGQKWDVPLKTDMMQKPEFEFDSARESFEASYGNDNVGAPDNDAEATKE